MFLIDRYPANNGSFPGYKGVITTGADASWQLANGFLLLYMQAGFSLFEAGSIRAKNVKDILSRNLIDLCLCTILFWAVGWGFAFGHEEHALDAIIGSGEFFLNSDDVPPTWLFQMGFAANTVTLSSGMLAERAQYWCYLFTTLVLGGVVYPVAAHSVWAEQGFLYKGIGGVRFIDFAGSGVVHCVGAFYGLIGCTMLGFRFGRFTPPNSAGADPYLATAQPGATINGEGSNSSALTSSRDQNNASMVSLDTVLDHRGNTTVVQRIPHGGVTIKPASTTDVELGGVLGPSSASERVSGFPSGMPRDQDDDQVDEDEETENETATQSTSAIQSSRGHSHPAGPVGSGNGSGVTPTQADGASSATGEWESVPIEGHSATEMVAGTFILWYGWFAFNVGSVQAISESELVRTAARISLTMTLAPAAAGLTSCLMHRFVLETNFWCLDRMCNAVLCALVAVTGGCAVIDAWCGVLLGVVACVVYELSSHMMVRFRLDDPVDGFAVHGCGGALGIIWIGLFAKPSHLATMGYSTCCPGLFMGGGFDLLGVQLVGLLYVIAITVVAGLLVFLPLSLTGRLKVSLLDELAGLDVAKHGGSAYPEWDKSV